MKPGRPRTGAATLRQRGFALIAMIALAAIVTAFLIALGLNRSQSELLNEREDRNMTALRQAKAALIAYAASEQWQNTGGATPFQPGALPCPDLDNDGIAEDHELPQNPCNLPKERVGRFPWKTVGAEDLRDAAGERLWYAVSANFLKNTPAYRNVINSDTQGQLTVTGAAPAVNVVAVLFAPGEIVQNEARVPTNPATYNDPVNFLEQFNNVTYDVFTSVARPIETLNDRVLVVTQADLMAAVEPVVAANLERDVKPFLTNYASPSQWGRFPFAAQWNALPAGTPGSSGSGTNRSPWTFVGVPGASNGLLPISAVAVSAASNASPIVVTTSSPHALSTGDAVLIWGVQGNAAANGNYWTVTVVDATRFRLNGSAGSGSYTSGGTVTPQYPWTNWAVSKTGGSGIIDNVSCVKVTGPPGLQCTFRVRDQFCFFTNCINNLRFQVQADVGANAGLSFAVVPDKSDVSTTDNGVPTTFLSDSIAGSLDNVGLGTVTYRAIYQPNCFNTCVNHNIVVTIPDVVPSRFTNASDPLPSASWFIANEWYRQTFYAVAPDLLPGAGGTCGPAPLPPCLTVTNLPPRFTTSSDKQAILILAGRTLNGSPRPSSTWNNYMEGANQTATVTNTYENRAGSPTSINDRVVVVSP